MKGLFIFMAFLLFNVGLPAQNSRSVLYKVMTLTGGKSGLNRRYVAKAIEIENHRKYNAYTGSPG
jgi:hypothetical protein